MASPADGGVGALVLDDQLDRLAAEPARCVGPLDGQLGGIGQRLADRRAVTGLRHEQPDAQGRRRPTVGASVVAVTTGGGSVVASSSSPCRRSRAQRRARRPSATTVRRHGGSTAARASSQCRRPSADRRSRARRSAIPYPAAMAQTVETAREAVAQRRRVGGRDLCRRLAEATDEVLADLFDDAVASAAGSRRGGRGGARGGRRLRAGRAGPAERHRRRARRTTATGAASTSWRPPSGTRCGTPGCSSVTPCGRTTTSSTWPATTWTRRRRCSAPGASPATTSCRLGWPPRRWPGGDATVVDGSTPCGRGCSSGGSRPATWPSCSNPTSRSVTVGCATCTRCGGPPMPTSSCRPTTG